MTTLLRKVFNRVGKMSMTEQNAIAKLLAEEMSWKKSYENSQKELLSLSEEATVEYKKKKTHPLRFK